MICFYPKENLSVCNFLWMCHFQGLSFRLSTCFSSICLSAKAGQAVTSEHCAAHRCLALLRLASLLCADTTVSAVSAKMEKQDLDRFLNREKWGYSKIFDVLCKSWTTSKNASMSSSGPAWRGIENKYTFVTIILSCQIAPKYSGKNMLYHRSRSSRAVLLSLTSLHQSSPWHIHATWHVTQTQMTRMCSSTWILMHHIGPDALYRRSWCSNLPVSVFFLHIRRF